MFFVKGRQKAVINVQRATFLRERPGVRQFIKFGIVGASSTAVNFVCFNVLEHKIGVSLLASLTLAFLIAAVNGFSWNRCWTFRGGRTKAIHTQSLQFLLVNLIGWFLNTSIVVVIVAHLTTKGMNILGTAGQYRHVLMTVVSGEGGRQYGFWQLNGALAIATLVVMFWNFFANRFWTFRH